MIMNALNTNLFDQSYTSPRQTDKVECTQIIIGRVIYEIILLSGGGGGTHPKFW